jgi:hypothetical protein
MQLTKGLNIRWKRTPTPLNFHEQTFNMFFNRIKPKKVRYMLVFLTVNTIVGVPIDLVLYKKTVSKREPVFKYLWYGKP